jgi:hypothetical protein
MKAMKMNGTGTVRASISFPAEVCRVVEGMARQKNVSLA